MIGSEPKQENDLFFVCSVIEYIARKTKNTKAFVIARLGEQELTRIYELADVFHCEPIEYLGDDLIMKYDISMGDFDNVGKCKYRVPTHFDIGKVYKRLIVSVSGLKNISFINALIEVYNSWICAKIDDLNSSMYFESPQYIFESYKLGEPIKD
jgi:hypothetical protein